jgi:signal transduction histidine kinase
MTPADPSAQDPIVDAALEAARVAARERQSHVRHELRAPLAVIYPVLSLLRDGSAGDLTPRQEEHLAVLERNVERLEALISGTVASGWADCSPAPPIAQAVALGDVAEEVVTLRRMEGDDGASVLVDAGVRMAPRVCGDRDDVRQILTDLVANASAYTPPDGSATIRAHRGDGGTVVVDVADNGPGIPPEELDRVFAFGFRGELARTLKIPGLGAGLWVCRELARRNGGDVVVASEPGHGVTARLTLPAAERSSGSW